jgi:hypothetical protein
MIEKIERLKRLKDVLGYVVKKDGLLIGDFKFIQYLFKGLKLSWTAMF